MYVRHRIVATIGEPLLSQLTLSESLAISNKYSLHVQLKLCPERGGSPWKGPC